MNAPHRYVTVILDYESGRIIWMGEGRSEETLDSFFSAMPEEVRNGIVAVATDMWKPYLLAIKKWCSGAKVVFDLFHLVKDFNRVIDKIRNEEYRKADAPGKRVPRRWGEPYGSGQAHSEFEDWQHKCNQKVNGNHRKRRASWTILLTRANRLLYLELVGIR